MPTVLLVGALDTKGAEYQLLAEVIRASGCETLIVDTGLVGPPGSFADVSREVVAEAVGATIEDLNVGGRSAAVDAMTVGAMAVVGRLLERGAFHGVCGLGGSAGSLQIGRVMQSLPLGMPKVLVSTMASGDTRPFVGVSDICVINPVVDIAGPNEVLTRALRNAGVTIAAMVHDISAHPMTVGRSPAVAATMFGVTTAAANAARALCHAREFEVMMFHAVGTGGTLMERMLGDGAFVGVIDLTTSELAAELLGSPMAATGSRMEAAGLRGVPQVLAPGCLDIAVFGAEFTVPIDLRDRVVKVSDAVSIVGTSLDERRELGRRFALKANQAVGPVAVLLPMRGVSPDTQVGGILYEPDGDATLFGAITDNLRADIEVVRVDTSAMEPEFGVRMAETLLRWLA